MNSSELADAFNLYLISRQPSDSLSAIVNLWVSGRLSPKTFNDVCVLDDLQDSPSFKEELLDLILFYIQHCIKVHALTAKEGSTIRDLKLLFRIREGDFYKHRLREVKQVVVNELNKILADKTVDRIEALYQTNLQEIFGLSYDQYLKITSEPVGKIVNDVIAQITGDNLVTDEEREQLVQQIMALDTVYKLNAKQRRMVFEN